MMRGVLEEFGAISVTAILGSGVYVLVYNGRVVYVGQSKKVLGRIHMHRTMWERYRQGKALPGSGPYSKVKAKRFDEVYVIPCATKDLDRVEKEMIRVLNPPQNIQGKANLKIDLRVLGLTIVRLPQLAIARRV